MAKDKHPFWVLTSKESKARLARGEKPEDFTSMPQWCNPELYENSIRKLLKLHEAETPHAKATIIESAIQEAVEMILISTPYSAKDKFGENER